MNTRKVPPTCGETYATVCKQCTEWVSKNEFKISTSETICMHFCTQCKQFAAPSIMLDKTTIKAVTGAKFPSVVFDRILSYVVMFTM